jgi:acetyl-CoA synthetase
VETVVAVLALGRLRAIYTPIFSGYAPPAIAARLIDCEASMLITADGFLRRGTWVPLKAVADDAVASVPSVRRVVVVRRAGDSVDTPWTHGRDTWWHEPVGDDAPDARTGADAETATDPETPYMIIYTSGTTGRPKGAVHVHGGFPIKGAQDLAHQFDLGAGDSLFWFTDLGWMMGPWAISGALLRGARLVLYEGAPDHPGPDRLWAIVAGHRVSHLGLSPTVIRALMAHGEELVRGHDRSSLRVLGSTGEPWNPEPWWWYFRVVGEGRCPIINYSGGTEVSGGIVAGNVLGPIKPASFSGPCIGTAADVVDEAGRPIRGAVGELVIRAPMPGMTRGFWRDEEGRYEATYWSRFPGAWVHGDWATIDDDGFWYIQGRSDDTLKVAGKRVGPAEVESAAVSHPAVLEAAAIGVPHEIKGEAVVVLVVLRPGADDHPDLAAAIAATVAGQLGKPLKPERVAVVPALPKTRSGKVMRRAIRAAWLGIDPGDLSSLDDPGTLEAIRAVATGARAVER